MNAQNQLAKDTKISQKLAAQIIGLSSKVIAEVSSKNELVKSINTAPNSKFQFLIAHSFMNLAEEAGMSRNGSGCLADTILDAQSRKVARYGQDSFPMSDKQLMVIVNQVWVFLK